MNTKKNIIISLIGSIFLLIIGYVVNNQSIFTQERVIGYSISQRIGGLLGSKPNNYEDSVFYVDVSAIKKLYSYQDSAGSLLSFNDWLTDREILNQFISCCRNAGGYRYIIVDLRFEANSSPEIDSLLFSTINNTPNIIIAKNSNRDISYQYIDDSKIAFAEYPIADNFSDFTRFPLYVDKDQYIYTKVYEDLSGNKISRFGPLYFDNNRLCHNSIFIKLASKEVYDVITTEQFDEIDEDEIPATEINPISELLDSLEISLIPSYIKGRYVVIGNFKDDDKHDTYVGYKQGSELVFNAIMTLNNHSHLVNWFFACCLFVLYFGILLLVGKNYSIQHLIPFVRHSNSKILRFIFSIIEYSVIFILVDIVLFIIFGIAYSFIAQTFVIVLYKYFIEYKQLPK